MFHKILKNQAKLKVSFLRRNDEMAWMYDFKAHFKVGILEP